jgi:tetratricopeptide (TPR) repeat protein
MKRQGKSKPRPRELDELRPVYVSEYEITTSAIQDRRYKRLPRHVKDAFERLHYESQSQPHKAIPELLEWIGKYPNIPILYNYLGVAYSMSGQREKAKEVVRDNYRRNPDYLFARLNYAQLFLVEGDYEKVAEILDHKFDLKLLYPRRKRFHVTEAANFMGVVGEYYLGIGERDAAIKYYDILKQIAPDFPITRQLRRMLYPGLLRRLLGRLAGRSKSGLVGGAASDD